MNATVSEKGQVIIPKPLRERLGIGAGQVVDFSEEHGRLVLTKQRTRDPIDEVYGILKTSLGDVDEFIDEIRGSADHL